MNLIQVQLDGVQQVYSMVNTVIQVMGHPLDHSIYQDLIPLHSEALCGHHRPHPLMVQLQELLLQQELREPAQHHPPGLPLQCGTHVQLCEGLHPQAVVHIQEADEELLARLFDGDEQQEVRGLQQALHVALGDAHLSRVHVVHQGAQDLGAHPGQGDAAVGPLPHVSGEHYFKIGAAGRQQRLVAVEHLRPGVTAPEGDVREEAAGVEVPECVQELRWMISISEVVCVDVAFFVWHGVCGKKHTRGSDPRAH